MLRRRLYPPTVKVGKASYAVHIVPLGKRTAGYCEDDMKLIALDPDQSDKEMFSSFVHELLHAIEKEHKLKLPHKKVYALEAALAQVLADNFHIYPKR